MRQFVFRKWKKRNLAMRIINAIFSKDKSGAVIWLDGLTDSERVNVMLNYCKHCGSIDTSCQCWNDE